MTQVVCGLVGVFLLFLVLYAGFRGIEDPTHNFSIIFVFYTFWLGMVVLSVLLGDVFRAFNPWRAIGRVVSGGFRLVAGQSAPTPFRYPGVAGPLARRARRAPVRLAGADRGRGNRTDARTRSPSRR